MDKALTIERLERIAVFMPKLCGALALMVVAACAVTPKPDVAVGIPCNAGPIILDKADQITTPTLRQIITINRAGQKLCNWQKPSQAAAE